MYKVEIKVGPTQRGDNLLEERPFKIWNRRIPVGIAAEFSFVLAGVRAIVADS
jgi:hypothetical protein